VTASKEGFANGSVTVGPKEVAKLSSSTSASTPNLIVREGSDVPVRVTVRGDEGVVPSGAVQVFDGREQLATGELDGSGRVTVPVSGLDRGIHLLTVKYDGTDQLRGSTSWPVLVIVW
jgi:5'-nucleotidase